MSGFQERARLVEAAARAEAGSDAGELFGVLVCDGCGKQIAHHGPDANRVIEQRAKARGWLLGQELGAGDLCAECKS